MVSFWHRDKVLVLQIPIRLPQADVTVFVPCLWNTGANAYITYIILVGLQTETDWTVEAVVKREC